MPIHSYQVYGLTVTSELTIPAWECIEEVLEPDIIIKFADLPTIENGYLQVNQQCFQIDIGEVARFTVKEGKYILVQIYQNANQAHVLRFLESRIMSILLFQRNLLPLSASTIYTNDKCYILTGSSAYATKVLPSWYHKAEENIVLNSYLSPVFTNAQTIAGSCYMNEKPLKYANTYHKIDGVIELCTNDVNSFDTQQIMGAEKFNILRNNIYYKDVIQDLDFKPLFHNFTELLQQAAFYRIILPQDNFSFNLLVQQLNHIFYDH